MALKLALPKGGLQSETAVLLERAGFGLDGYDASSRSYRPASRAFPELFIKVFHEKDVAVQVAIGNYDLAVCGFDWFQELRVKYHTHALVKIRDLGYGRRELYAATAKNSPIRSLAELQGKAETVRIVSEYPNLAEAFAFKLRLRRFRVMPLWGAPEAYPPEHADIALVAAVSPTELDEKGLAPLARILSGHAWLVANRESMERKDLSRVLRPFHGIEPARGVSDELSIAEVRVGAEAAPLPTEDGAVRLALPDGHQQIHTREFLRRIGLEVCGYEGSPPSRRPAIAMDGVKVTVIRPQDMPTQVANGNFDLAVTGRDWLHDQLYQFPSSPVEELLDFGFGRVRIVAVVHNDLPVSAVSDLSQMLRSGRIPVLRIAAEYTNIADQFARDHHLSPYRVIPTWGATEAFLPEDADVLIENTETGRTLAKNNLRIIETLFESTACLIGNSGSLRDPAKKDRIQKLIEWFQKGV